MASPRSRSFTFTTEVTQRPAKLMAVRRSAGGNQRALTAAPRVYSADGVFGFRADRVNERGTCGDGGRQQRRDGDQSSALRFCFCRMRLQDVGFGVADRARFWQGSLPERDSVMLFVRVARHAG
jgi:hypothetical protein